MWLPNKHNGKYIDSLLLIVLKINTRNNEVQLFKTQIWKGLKDWEHPLLKIICGSQKGNTLLMRVWTKSAFLEGDLGIWIQKKTMYIIL